MNLSTRRHVRPQAISLFAAALLLACGADRVAALERNDSVRATIEQVPEEISLAGEWAFQLDSGDEGFQQGWQNRRLSDRIMLPGSLQARGFGDDVTPKSPWTGNFKREDYDHDPRYAPYRRADHVKVPFCLQPEKMYVGPAWYQRTVDFPDGWRGRRVVARLERCHWTTTAWLDGREVGTSDSLSTPNEFELTRSSQPGTHVLTVRVDNRLKVNVGPDAHSVSDHTQTNWNGIIGRMTVRATPPVWLERVRVVGNAAEGVVHVRATIGNSTNEAGAAVLSVEALGLDDDDRRLARKSTQVNYSAGSTTVVETDYSLGPGARRWDEFDPFLYRVNVVLEPKEHEASRQSLRIGLRDVSVKGTQLAVNGQPRFLRGTLECCVFPLTGYPPTDVAAWTRIFRICREHGLNHVRFHSYCPPEAAFDAADQQGVYLQVEAACWAHVGQGHPIDQWIYEETQRILDAYGNHPSFILMAHGNEPWPNNASRDAYLEKWTDHFKKREPRQLFTAASGWPKIEANQYHLTPEPRIQQWGEGLKSRINARPPETMTDYRAIVEQNRAPVVCHELGQWCAYPNVDEIDKYAGVLKAKNLEIFRDFLREAGLAPQAKEFLAASGKLQMLCYKEDIEATLRTPGFAGFQLLGLSDFPGQGTAPVGILDAFWDDKSYASAQEFRQFCRATVPLARLPTRVFAANESIVADVDIAHYGPTDLRDAVVSWRLVDDRGREAARGEIAPLTLAAGRLTPVGSLRIPLASARCPSKLTLYASVAGMPENNWELWAYPAPQANDAPPEVHIAHHLDEQARARLAAGKKVLLLADPKLVKTDVVLGFSSIFWNTSWTENSPPHTLGLICDPRHAAFANFPTDFCSNWQWWEIVNRAATMELDGLPSELKPLIQVTPDWFNPKRLALAFEAQIEGGKLLVCSADLSTDLSQRHAARQLRNSLIDYMQSDAFAPTCAVTVEQVRALFSNDPDE